MIKPLPQLPPRESDSHKGNYGRALLIGGSRGMSGAIALSGMSTLRSGAGLTKLAVPDVCLDLVASFEPSYMTAALASDSAGRISLQAKEALEELASEATCIAIGPGLGRSDELVELVTYLYKSVSAPMVLDADSLFALTARPDDMRHPGGPRVLTPHPGEFQRLIGKKSADRNEAESAAEALAKECGIVVLLKGRRTLITDGQQSSHNETGNPGMASGGSGDVLTGILTALICQHLAPVDAARLGAHVHGLAGDIAAEELGQISLIASDLVRCLPKAFQRL